MVNLSNQLFLEGRFGTEVKLTGTFLDIAMVKDWTADGLKAVALLLCLKETKYSFV
jgi:hypothetical protein